MIFSALLLASLVAVGDGRTGPHPHPASQRQDHMGGRVGVRAGAAPQQEVWEAERAFAAKAQTDGQWAAFRANAAPEGVMFLPGMTNAQSFLATAKEPPLGSMQWGPNRALTACDGSLAFSTGPWTTAKGQGTFSTIWRRQPDGGWKWLYDSGRDTPAKVTGGGAMKAAAPVCRNLSRATAHPETTGTTSMTAIAARARPDLLVQEDMRMPAAAGRDAVTLNVGAPLVGGRSEDGSLVWSVARLEGTKEHAHMLRVWAWDGAAYRLAVLDVNGAG